MIQILFIILSLIININIASRRLLQTTNGIPSSPNPVNPALPQLPGNNIPVMPFNPAQLVQPQLPVYITGYYGQQCLAIQPDFGCTMVGQTLTDAGTGTVECGVASSCCACQTVLCGYSPNGRYCDNIKVGAPNALYGVKQVAIRGLVNGPGAVMDCGGQGSCAGTYILGEWVNTMICGGPDACRDSYFDFQFSKGLICNTRACIGTTFNFPSNLGGAISCDAPEACMNSVMNIAGNIQNIKCGGRRGCKDAKITLTNPMEHFHLICGPQGCEGLTVELIITGPAATTGCLAPIGVNNFIEWKGITCGGNGACVGLTLSVINNGCRPVRIEDFNCMAGQSCVGSNFHFNAGASPYPLALQNCHCGLSCNQATGVDLCFNNIHVLECLNRASCPDQSLTNIANGFMLLCPNVGSCKDLYLNIAIYGASQNIIQRISLFDCSGMVSCQGLTVDISNMQLSVLTNAPIEIVIDTVICAQQGSCQDATFITGNNVRIENFICALTDSCDNCLIKTDINDVGVPCNPADIITTTTTTTAIPAADPNTAPVVDPVAVDPIPDVAIPDIPSIPSIPDPVAPVDTSTIPSIPSIPNVNVAPTDPKPADVAPVDYQPPTDPSAPIPDLPPAVDTPQADPTPIDVQQTGGAPAPPQVDTVPAAPIVDPVIPVVQTGGIVVETGNTNTNNGATPSLSPPPQQAGPDAIVPPSLV